MRRLAVWAMFLLVACGDDLTPEEKNRADERDIAMVEKANRGEAVPVAPQPILFRDIESNNLYGASCAFVEEGGGIGSIALAMIDDGYMKIDGKLIRFAADKGSPEFPMGARARYVGKQYEFDLDREPGHGRSAGLETVNYDGRLTVWDSKHNVVYDKPGLLQCGS